MERFTGVRSQKGFSIIEVLIGATIMSVIALGMATVFTNAFRSQSTINKRDAARDVAREIRMILGNPTACMNTLGAKTIGGPATSALPVRDAAGTSVFTATNPAIQSLMYTSAGTTGTLVFKGRTNLSPTEAGVGGEARDVNILISLMPNGAGGITSCAALSEMTDGIWQREAPLSQNIYFGTPNTGNVGIGIFAPTSKLHVESGAADVMTIERDGIGDLNSTLQFRNGAAKSLFLGMAADETFGVGPTPNLTSSNTWFEVNRNLGAQIRATAPAVLKLLRVGSGQLNSAVEFMNGSNQSIFAGMSGAETFGVGPNANLLSSETWFRINRNNGALIRARQADVLTVEREGAGNLNASIQFKNGSNQTMYLGMSRYEDFGIGNNPNLAYSDTWFQVSRNRGALIRSAVPEVLTLERTATGLNSTIKFVNSSSGDVYAGMSSTNAFAVGQVPNLASANWLSCTAAGCETPRISTPSDEQLKKDIKPIPNALQRLLSIHGVAFTWNEKSVSAGQNDLGVIAQQVAQVFPELVRKSAQSLFNTVSYSSLIAPIIEAIRELNNSRLAQETEIQKLRREMAELKVQCSKR